MGVGERGRIRGADQDSNAVGSGPRLTWLPRPLPACRPAPRWLLPACCCDPPTPPLHASCWPRLRSCTAGGRKCQVGEGGGWYPRAGWSAPAVEGCGGTRAVEAAPCSPSGRRPGLSPGRAHARAPHHPPTPPTTPQPHSPATPSPPGMHTHAITHTLSHMHTHTPLSLSLQAATPPATRVTRKTSVSGPRRADILQNCSILSGEKVSNRSSFPRDAILPLLRPASAMPAAVPGPACRPQVVDLPAPTEPDSTRIAIHAPSPTAALTRPFTCPTLTNATRGGPPSHTHTLYRHPVPLPADGSSRYPDKLMLAAGWLGRATGAAARGAGPLPGRPAGAAPGGCCLCVQPA